MNLSRTPLRAVFLAVFTAIGTLPAASSLYADPTTPDNQAPVAQTPVAHAAAVPAVHGPAKAQPILPFDQVRIGMKGYGLTVFAGTKIESFPVEVISIQGDFAPNHAVVWIRCPDDRMQKSGPVQGMSGSPIYLWDNDEPQVQGKGGKLIGAFAFGFSASKDCYVGVQPIEYMRQAGDRADKQLPLDATADASPMSGPSSLKSLMSMPQTQMLPQSMTWRGRTLLAVTERHFAKSNLESDGLTSPLPLASVAGVSGTDGHVVRMTLPVCVGSPEMAAMMAPMLEPYGLSPMATGIGLTAGKPPFGIDPKTIRFEPGSVLSLPLAWGDADLNAAGTVTDVLPDGRVLGFGHAMFGQGPLAIPMATGFVHVVMPSIISSFKLAGSAQVQGTLVRDENCAVIGKPVATYESAPVTVTVQMPDQPKRVYHYFVALHKPLAPAIVNAVVSESLSAAQNFPRESTANVKATFQFEGSRDVRFEMLVPLPNPAVMGTLIVPVLSAMSQNPVEPMKLHSLDISIDVQNGVNAIGIVKSRIDRDNYAPGEEVGVTLHLQPYNKPAFDKRVTFKLPRNLANGDYALQLCDAMSYNQMILASRPYLLNVTSGDDVTRLVRQVMSISNNNLYAVIQLQQRDGIAVGPQEMPRIPSSRRAMIETPSNPGSIPYTELFDQKIPMDSIIDGAATFVIHIDKNLYPRP